MSAEAVWGVGWETLGAGGRSADVLLLPVGSLVWNKLKVDGGSARSGLLVSVFISFHSPRFQFVKL